MQVSGQLMASASRADAAPAMQTIVAQQKGFLITQLTVLGHAADTILGNVVTDVPTLSDEVRVGLEGVVENLFPAAARPFIGVAIGAVDNAAQQEEKELDSEAVKAIMVGKANVDAVIKNLGG